MQPDCFPRLAGGRHEIPVAGSGRPALDDEQVQASEENHRHHPYHPVLRILLRCRAVHHLVDVCRRGLGVGLKQSLFFVGVGLVPTLIGRCKQPSWAGTSPAPTCADCGVFCRPNPPCHCEAFFAEAIPVWKDVGWVERIIQTTSPYQ